MDELAARARDAANALLREGVLDPRRDEHAELRERLLTDDALFSAVQQRVGDVGFDLVQFLGHMGVRLTRDAELGAAVDVRNNLGLDVRHIRLIVFFWVQLVYRQIKATLREEPAQQAAYAGPLRLDLGDAGELVELSWAEVVAAFEADYGRSTIKSLVTGLKRWRFVTQDGATGPLRAGPALYVLVDPLLMEEFVVGLARRGQPFASEEDPA